MNVKKLTRVPDTKFHEKEQIRTRLYRHARNQIFCAAINDC